MKKTLFAAGCSVLLALLFNPATPGWTQEAEEYKKHPGYFDLSSVPALGETKEAVEIFLTPGLAKLVAGLENNDPGAQKLLSALKLIKVYSFDAKQNDRTRLAEKISELSKKLIAAKWERFLRAQDEHSRTEIFMRTQNTAIHGMVILSLNESEASFINIVGTLDLEAMGKLSKKFDIPQLDTLKAKR